MRLGCYNRATPCSVAAGGRIDNLIHGSDITINDPTAPSVTVEASGLLAGGARNGSDPVTLTASDNSGIQRVELIDVTNAAAAGHWSASRTTAPAAPTPTGSATTHSPPRARP